MLSITSKWWLVMAGFHQRIGGIEHKKGINENTGRLYKSLSNQDQDIYTLVCLSPHDVNHTKALQ